MALVAPVAERPAVVSRANTTAPKTAALRDKAVDVARAWALVVVVALHAMMVGVSAPDGVPVFMNTMAAWEGFPLASWFVQVMPLFFILGGFSAYSDWTRRREAGAAPGTYLITRVQRLALPALGAVGATAVLLAILSLSGMDAAVIAEAGFRISQPFWFLGVYFLCTVLVPLAVEWHLRAPRLTVCALALAALAVDIVRASTGVEWVGMLNLAFVWLLAQQLGFFLADGSVSRLGRRALTVIAISAVAVLALTQAMDVYPRDLYDALNPPTMALILLGIAQLCVFEMLRPRLRRVYRVAPVRRAVDAIGSRSMTVYAWHMPVLIALAGVLLFFPSLLPEPLSAAWWQTRALWLLGAGLAVGLVAFAVGGIERSTPARLPASVRISTLRAFVVAVIGAAGVVTVLVQGSAPAAWTIGAALVLLSLVMAAEAPRVTVRRARRRAARNAARSVDPRSKAVRHAGEADRD